MYPPVTQFETRAMELELLSRSYETPPAARLDEQAGTEDAYRKVADRRRACFVPRAARSAC
jgi:hypothetical protein